MIFLIKHTLSFSYNDLKYKMGDLFFESFMMNKILTRLQIYSYRLVVYLFHEWSSFPTIIFIEDID